MCSNSTGTHHFQDTLWVRKVEDMTAKKAENYCKPLQKQPHAEAFQTTDR